MHPVIGIAGVVALAVGLASAEPAALALATAALLIVALRTAGPPPFLASIRRLRWLLASVVLLYAWLLPGQPLLAALGDWSPSRAGLAEGLLRAWMLVLMAAAARLLLASCTRSSLVGAVYWYLQPLARIGLSPDRFCLRLVLTLEYAAADADRSRHRADTADDAGAGFMERAARLATRRLAAAEAAGAGAPADTINLPRTGSPPSWQWCLPAALLIALLVLASLG